MNRIELKKQIENDLLTIINLKADESEIVIAIVKKSLKGLLKIREDDFEIETQREIFVKNRIIMSAQILIELEFLENKNESYLSDNFFQIKFTLLGIVSVLNL
jgi:hypothetical protein